MSLSRQIITLILSLAVCFAAAGIGSFATAPHIDNWYAGLAKPSWSLPLWGGHYSTSRWPWRPLRSSGKCWHEDVPILRRGR